MKSLTIMTFLLTIALTIQSVRVDKLREDLEATENAVAEAYYKTDQFDGEGNVLPPHVVRLMVVNYYGYLRPDEIDTLNKYVPGYSEKLIYQTLKP